MRSTTARTLTIGLALHAAALVSQPMAVRAQAPIAPAAPNHEHHLGCGCCLRGPVIPRTYSYYYNYGFNQPRHTRVRGADGRCYWITTVHGLPRDVPYPSY
jgi:hypothetical protein